MVLKWSRVGWKFNRFAMRKNSKTSRIALAIGVINLIINALIIIVIIIIK